MEDDNKIVTFFNVLSLYFRADEYFSASEKHSIKQPLPTSTMKVVIFQSGKPGYIIFCHLH